MRMFCATVGHMLQQPFVASYIEKKRQNYRIIVCSLITASIENGVTQDLAAINTLKQGLGRIWGANPNLISVIVSQFDQGLLLYCLFSRTITSHIHQAYVTSVIKKLFCYILRTMGIGTPFFLFLVQRVSQ